MDKKTTTKGKTVRGKVVQASLNGPELKQFHDLMPGHLRAEAAWARQLILERLAQLEQANGKGR